MGEAKIRTTTDGAILFDATAATQAGSAECDASWFDADYWRARDAAAEISGGRGGALIAHSAAGDWVLRHYRRGGMVARLFGDRYLWTGEDRTRGFAEFRMLAALRKRGAHVPDPIAARYRRHGAHYQADLITQRLPSTVTLADRLSKEGLDSALAKRVGAELAQLHALGAYHADLNAHNLLIDTRNIWVIDFDRGELRSPARSWQLSNLSRLRRSLIKLGAARDGEVLFDRTFWQPLMAEYEHRFGEIALENGSTRSIPR
jgi:3-deoxy-D-manno-octulosonic acid kinase